VHYQDVARCLMAARTSRGEKAARSQAGLQALQIREGFKEHFTYLLLFYHFKLVRRSQDRIPVASFTGIFSRGYRQNHVPWGQPSL